MQNNNTTTTASNNNQSSASKAIVVNDTVTTTDLTTTTPKYGEGYTDVKSNWDKSVDSFDELELKKDLVRGIYGYGYERPSAIQSQGILPML
jgi:hypothetical protein